MKTERTPDYPIEPLFINRWSPRAFEAIPMPEDDLLTILEAARWAPSAYNIQPWRFLYSHRNDPHWLKFLDLLDPFNSSWAQHASALVYVLSDTVMSGDGSRPDSASTTHSFDAGAAWAQMALQATSMGYQAHAMAGINFGLTQKNLVVPERFQVEIAIAVGQRADPIILSEDLRDQEIPSQRLSVHEIAFAGGFPH